MDETIQKIRDILKRADVGLKSQGKTVYATTEEEGIWIEQQLPALLDRLEASDARIKTLAGVIKDKGEAADRYYHAMYKAKGTIDAATKAAQDLKDAIEDAQYIDNNWQEGHEVQMQLGGLATQLLSILKGGYPLESEKA